MNLDAPMNMAGLFGLTWMEGANLADQPDSWARYMEMEDVPGGATCPFWDAPGQFTIKYWCEEDIDINEYTHIFQFRVWFLMGRGDIVPPIKFMYRARKLPKDDMHRLFRFILQDLFCAAIPDRRTDVRYDKLIRSKVEAFAYEAIRSGAT